MFISGITQALLQTKSCRIGGASYHWMWTRPWWLWRKVCWFLYIYNKCFFFNISFQVQPIKPWIVTRSCFMSNSPASEIQTHLKAQLMTMNFISTMSFFLLISYGYLQESKTKYSRENLQHPSILTLYWQNWDRVSESTWNCMLSKVLGRIMLNFLLSVCSQSLCLDFYFKIFNWTFFMCFSNGFVSSPTSYQDHKTNTIPFRSKVPEMFLTWSNQNRSTNAWSQCGWT